MAELTPCRLVNGPFHGSEGPMTSPPLELMVVACLDVGCYRGSRCPDEGAHWYLPTDPEAKGGEKYVRAGMREGVMLYLYADCPVDPDLVAKDEVGELVGA